LLRRSVSTPTSRGNGSSSLGSIGSSVGENVIELRRLGAELEPPSLAGDARGGEDIKLWIDTERFVLIRTGDGAVLCDADGSNSDKPLLS
jgi:hypothetical protein